jgi:hypothetical protein
MRALVLLPFAALLALGCSSSMTDAEPGLPVPVLRDAEGIAFQPQRPAYRRGDTATIVLRNGTGEPLGYNLCISSRELRAGASWKRFSPLRVCTLELRILQPGGETQLREPITAEWEAGEYRMVTTVERMRSGNRGEIFSASFTVGR